jgi:glutamate carboxypeptidase
MHTDTVFPKSTGFTKFVRSGERATGPGVIDNKGGIVVALHALSEYLRAQPQPPYSIRVVVSPSEEVGSTGFLDTFAEYGRDSAVVLGFEPALENGNIVTSRRGDRWYNISVEGVEAHAGRNHKKGANACHELSMKIEKLQALTDYGKDVSISIGRMEGGKDKHAIVCGWATAKLDVRFSDLKSRERILEKVEKILNQTYVKSFDGGVPTKTTYTIVDDPKPFPAESKGQALVAAYVKAASSLENRTVAHERSGGSADSNFMYRPGLIIIDGLGATGANMHRPDEVIDLPSLHTRAMATVELLKQVPRVLD